MSDTHAAQKAWLVGAAIAFLTVGAFLPAFENGFVEYDDQDYVTQNPIVQKGLTWEGVGWAFGHAHAANWHPLTWISHMADVEFFGADAGGHHATSLLLHAATATILFLFLFGTTGRLWLAGWAALFFGVHPLRVESVAWIAERKDVLSGLFFVLTLLLYAHYARRVDAREDADHSALKKLSLQTRVFGVYCACLMAFACGLMSKSMLVTTPFVLLLLDFWPLNRARLPGRAGTGPGMKALLLEKVPFFALAAASSALTFVSQQAGGAVAKMEQFPFGLRLENAVLSYVRYLSKMVMPTDLSPFYPYPADWPTSTVLLCATLLVVLIAAAAWRLKTKPYLLWGLLWFLGILVPVIGLVQVGVQSLADRYTYLPAIGLTVALVWLGSDLTARSKAARQALAVGAALVAVILVALTFRQTEHWRNTWTLFSHARKVTVNNEVAEYGLGAALVQSGRIAEAVPYLERAVRLRTNYASAQSDLGTALMVLGRPQEAREHLNAALAQGLDVPEIRFNLASTLKQLGDTEGAIKEHKEALRKKPGFHEARFDLGMLELEAGRPGLARQEFQWILEGDPNNAKGALGLGITLVMEGAASNAIPHLERAVAREPGNPVPRAELAHALWDSGNTNAALNHYRAAQAAQLDVPVHLLERARKLAALGYLPRAVGRANAARALSAENPAVLTQAGLIYLQAGLGPEAFAALNRAYELRPSPEYAYDLALACLLQKNPRRALELLGTVLELRPDWAAALNEIAWLHATHVDPQIRNPAKAVEAAEKAVALTGRKEARCLGTLDAAYAAAGRFEDALRTAREAIAVATAANQPEVALAAKQRIELYETREPYRQP